jgi:hypothetical protein
VHAPGEGVGDRLGDRLAGHRISKAESPGVMSHEQPRLMKALGTDFGIERKSIAEIGIHPREHPFHLVGGELGREERRQASMCRKLGGQFVELASRDPLDQGRVGDAIEHLGGDVPSLSGGLLDQSLAAQAGDEIANEQRHGLRSIDKASDDLLGDVRRGA